jgi:hypothetical protein
LVGTVRIECAVLNHQVRTVAVDRAATIAITGRAVLDC